MPPKRKPVKSDDRARKRKKISYGTATWQTVCHAMPKVVSGGRLKHSDSSSKPKPKSVIPHKQQSTTAKMKSDDISSSASIGHYEETSRLTVSNRRDRII